MLELVYTVRYVAVQRDEIIKWFQVINNKNRQNLDMTGSSWTVPVHVSEVGSVTNTFNNVWADSLSSVELCYTKA